MDDLDAATLGRRPRVLLAPTTRPDNAVLSIVGDVDPDDRVREGRDYFGHLAAAAAEPPAAPRCHRWPDAPPGDLGADVPADAVYLTWRLPDAATPGFDALDLAFSVLGHGQTSRLHKQLVRGAETPRAPPPHDRADRRQLVRLRLRPGHATGVEPPSSRHELLAGRPALRRRARPSWSCAGRKAQFERHWLHELARVDSRADAFGEYATLHGDPIAVNPRIAEVAALSADDLARRVATWCGPDRGPR